MIRWRRSLHNNLTSKNFIARTFVFANSCLFPKLLQPQADPSNAAWDEHFRSYKKVIILLLTSYIFNVIINIEKGKEITKMQIQITLFATNGKYRPISTILEIESMKEYCRHKALYQKKAILNICRTRKTTWKILQSYSYTSFKVREYNPEKIAQEKRIEKLYKKFKKSVDNK
jgi:hypothetical protein